MQVNQEWENRPARRQVKPKRGDIKTVSEEGGEYNIWYNRYQGEMKRWDMLEKAEFRCNMARDAGKTMARPGAYFCIHFARGKCSRGAECLFLHRPPDGRDSYALTYDCFGREKHRAEREDKSGVGSFEKDNRCLYVGPCFTDDKSQATVERHFQEWGELDSVRFIQAKGVAFARFKWRACAEFAKESMMGQSLDNGEILDIRWAIDDPAVSAEYKQKYEAVIAQAVTEKLPIVGSRGTYLDYENGEAGGDDREEQNVETKKGSNAEYKTYYEDCAKYYRDMGDHGTAATYSEYSLHYAKLALEEEKDGVMTVEDVSPEDETVETEAVAEAEVVTSSGRKRKAASPIKSPIKKAKAASPIKSPKKSPVKVNALAMLSGYGSDSDGSD